MTGSYKICDYCKFKSSKDHDKFDCRRFELMHDEEVITGQNKDINWITVSKNDYNEESDKIQDGHYHFCTEKCLKEWVSKKGL